MSWKVLPQSSGNMLDWQPLVPGLTVCQLYDQVVKDGHLFMIMVLVVVVDLAVLVPWAIVDPWHTASRFLSEQVQSMSLYFN